MLRRPDSLLLVELHGDDGSAGYVLANRLSKDLRNRVLVNCSLMPTTVSGNLNGPAIAMAWRAAVATSIEGLRPETLERPNRSLQIVHRGGCFTP